MGDSQTTLFILAVSAGLNVLGDYLFVVVFGWGIVGAAASTVLCELLSSLFCLPFLQVLWVNLRSSSILPLSGP